MSSLVHLNPSSWGKVKTPACPLCYNTGTIEHILSSCSRALSEGWYHWRHNQVLKSKVISKGIRESKCTHATARRIMFVKAGEKQTKELLGWAAFHFMRVGDS